MTTAVFTDPDISGRVTANAWTALADLVAELGQPNTESGRSGVRKWFWPGVGRRWDEHGNPADEGRLGAGLEISKPGRRWLIHVWNGSEEQCDLFRLSEPTVDDIRRVLACVEL